MSTPGNRCCIMRNASRTTLLALFLDVAFFKRRLGTMRPKLGPPLALVTMCKKKNFPLANGLLFMASANVSDEVTRAEGLKLARSLKVFVGACTARAKAKLKAL